MAVQPQVDCHKHVQLVQGHPAGCVSSLTIGCIEMYRLLSGHAIAYLSFDEITRRAAVSFTAAALHLVYEE